METTGLVEICLPFAGRLQKVERLRRRREEAKSVNVGASGPHFFHDAGDVFRREPQRQIRMAGFLLPQTMHHRPFVHPETAEARRFYQRRAEQLMSSVNG